MKYALRTLLKSPGFTLVAILALALGIGTNTAIFSVVDAILLRPLPYQDPGRLMLLWERSPQLEGMSVAWPNFIDWQAQNLVFERMAARQGATFTLTGEGEPEMIEGSSVTHELFDLLGVKPILGRTFLPDEDKPGGSRVVVIAWSLWQRGFGGRPDILGKALTLSGDIYSVVGVMPQGFRYPYSHLKGEIWRSLGRFGDQNVNRGNHPGIYVVARLKPEVTVERARGDLDTIARRLQAQYPDTNQNNTIGSDLLHNRMVRDIRPALLVLMAAVGFVLLIACANVANLLLARAAGRQQEIAIRVALGARRWDLIRQLLAESLLLALAGGALGLALAFWGVRGLVAVAPEGTPRLSEIGVNTTALLFTLALSVVTGILFGLAPAIEASRRDIHDALKEGGRRASGDLRRQRARGALVVAEVALSMVLLVGAGLMIASFARLANASPGFDPANTLTLQIFLPDTKYVKPAQYGGFFEQLVERVKRLPHVRAAGATTPLLGGWQTGVQIEGRPDRGPETRPLTDIQRVTSDQFRAMGIPLRKGRYFTERDRPGAARVVIIDELFARTHFSNEDPIGKRIQIGRSEWMEIVGVVGHVKNYGVDQDSRIETFLPYLQDPIRWSTLVVRTDGVDPLSLVNSVRAEVLALDNHVPIYNVLRLEKIAADSIAQQKLSTLLLAAFAFCALVLAAVGLYGVISYSVTQRTQEIGIRLALGARAVDILSMVLRQGAAMAGVGLVVGLAAAVALTRLMSTLLFGISALDPATFTAVSAILAGVALAASYIPARRATRVDPIVALRYE